MLGLKRIRFRYTLRALFVFLTLFALWGGYHANRGWKERRAVAVLRQHHAKFGWGPSMTAAGWLALPRAAYCLVTGTLWGDWRIGDVAVFSPLNDELVTALADLPALESLYVSPTGASDHDEVVMRDGKQPNVRSALPTSALERILANATVSRLSLVACVIGDEDCHAIAKCRSIYQLDLVGCSFSDEGLAKIIALPSLWSFCFPAATVKGDKLGRAPPSMSLWNLRCFGTPVGDDFATFVARCPHVSYLEVGHEALGDSFVEALSTGSRVRDLAIYGNGLTDKCVLALTRMKSLRSVHLDQGWSNEAIASLRAAGVRVGPSSYYPDDEVTP